MDVKLIKWIYHLRRDYKMAKDITTKYFNKQVYDLKKVDESAGVGHGH